MKGAGFGLVGLLLCAGIIFYLMWGGPGNQGQVRTAMDAKQHSEAVINQATGRDSQGAAVTDAITYEEAPKGLLVKTVTPGSAIEKRYGLKPGDVILEAGSLELKGQTDPKGVIQLAFTNEANKLIVLRNNQKITLPDDRNVGVAATPPTPPPAQPTATPPASNEPAAPAQPDKRTNPKDQAKDILKKIPTH